MADSDDGDSGVVPAVGEGGVSVVVDINRSASYPLTLSIE